MSQRLVALLLIYGICVGMCLLGLAVFRTEPKRPDLYGLAVWPSLVVAVLSTPLILLVDFG